jgi:hypothetical protein
MTKLTLDGFENFFRYYQGLAHQRLALSMLYKALPQGLIRDDAAWVEQFRDQALEELPMDSIVLSGKEVELSWGGVLAMAKKAGAKFPEVVAAQAALESGWFANESGKFNIFGIKGKGTVHKTWEVYDGIEETMYDEFKDFESYEECVNYLVERWYLDWNGYKGVNCAKTAAECCNMLVAENYATDPNYAAKLISIINRQK